MIEIKDTVVTLDLFREQFCCDLGACKGACCIEGDAGAPVKLEEVAQLEEAAEIVWDELSPKAQEVIKAQGVVYTDQDGDIVTSIVDNKDCVFTCYDDKGCCYCAIDKAFREGRCKFQKPISCHLYPIRVKQFRNGTYGLNYHRWAVCRDAVECGKRLGVPVYKALKEPIIRRFGEDFYNALECAEDLLKEQE